MTKNSSPHQIVSFAMGLLLLTCFSACLAQDITPELEVMGTLGKKTYTNVRVVSITPQGLKLVHDAGISTIPVSALPKEWLAKYAPDASSMPPTGIEEKKIPATPPREQPVASGGASIKSFDPNCLVFIKTDNGSGSGFIAKMNDKTYVYTNAHVLCGDIGGFTTKIVSIKTAAGRVIPTPHELELSDMKDSTSEKGLEDMARFQVTLNEGETAYEISGLDPNTSMNSRVIAYGNSLGGDVVTSLSGEILGLGTDRIEISCEIVPGNSGGPVVLEQSKMVVGISTYIDASGTRDIWARGTKFDRVRRFALRPEKVTKWRRMQYTSLISSTAELNSFDRDTLSLAAACYLNPKPNNAGFDVSIQTRGDYELRKVLTEGSRHSLGQSIIAGMSKVNQRLNGSFGGNKALMSAQGVKPYFAEFFATVAQASSSQVLTMQNADRAPYLKKFIPELIRQRSEIHKEFMLQAARFK